jgi:hypothetical protein
MRRALGWLVSLWAASMIVGCTSEPVVRTATVHRQEPTRVRSLLIVVDDTLFSEAYREGTGARFSRTLGTTLKDTAGSIPVTLLQIDSASDPSALPKVIQSSHATQMMVVKATHLTTSSRGDAKAIWQVTVADLIVSQLPDTGDPSTPQTRIVTRAFYRDEVDAIVNTPLDLIDGGLDSNAQQMGRAIADKLRADHVLTPSDSPASVGAPTSLPPVRAPMPESKQAL